MTTTDHHALVPMDTNWQPILHRSNQVVLYNPTSHALAIRHAPQQPAPLPSLCPYCNRPLLDSDRLREDAEDVHSRASNYFQLLAIANETTMTSSSTPSSRPSTPPIAGPVRNGREREQSRSSTFPAEAMAEGYFKAFFQEECRLGMGANGSVFLCQHVLDGNALGHFAVKKIAVGESHSYLLKILREVRLLESLRHPNIITYHHAWLESCQFSSFGPKVPTLHVLMQWAEGGSLDDFIDARQGRRTNAHKPRIDPFQPATDIFRFHPDTADSDSDKDPDPHSRSGRIRAFRAFQRASPDERERMRREAVVEENSGGTTWTAVHLLSASEVRSLFGDVVDGLAFLHDKSILHLDLKPGNVLLTWDEGRLVPRAMLSDFGTSRDMIHSTLARTGNTGTLEYASPESLPSPHTGLLNQVDSKADMWSLGMILHKLIFLKLPYRYASDGGGGSEGGGDAEKMDALEKEVLSYSGFKTSPGLVAAFVSRRLPRAFLVLLESLLNVTPSSRPSCERVSSAIREGMLDPQATTGTTSTSTSMFLPVVRRSSDPDSHGTVDGKSAEGRMMATVSLSRPDEHELDRDLGHVRVSEDEAEDNDEAEEGESDSGGGRDGEERSGGGDGEDGREMWGSEKKKGRKGKKKKVLLGLPAPGEGGGGVGGSGSDMWGREVLGRVGVGTQGTWMRAVKAVVLVVKMLSIYYLFTDDSVRAGTGEVFVLSVMAAVDTVFNNEGNVLVSVVLGAAHVVVLKMSVDVGNRGSR